MNQRSYVCDDDQMQRGYYSSCQQINPALRSCQGGITRDDYVHGQNYGCSQLRRTVDVEDLGRCFEFDRNPEGKFRNVYNRGMTQEQKYYNKGVGNPSNSQSRNNYYCENIGSLMEDKVQMKNQTMTPETACDYLSYGETKMATGPINGGEIYSTKWIPQGNQYSYDTVAQDQQRYFEQVPKSFGPENLQNLNPRLNIPDVSAASVNQYHVQNQDRRTRTFDFCSEEQWLRCQAPQCPTMDKNYHFNTSLQSASQIVLPCMDYSSQLPFYYGKDIGYLTPAEYQMYEEDSLSNEKRKEKSRDAARCRRSRETDIFTDLANALPVPLDQASHLDKASVMRLAIAYLKVRTVIDAIPEPLAKPEPSPEMDGLFLKALDGFMMVLSSDGDMVYLSENVSEYLGVSQMDLMGQNVYDYSHPCDHEELRECLSMKPSSLNDKKQVCNLFLRLKCTLTSKGRKVNLKSASYKVIHCTGHMVITPRNLSTPAPQSEDSDDSSGAIESPNNNNKRQEKESGGCLVVVGCPVPHPSNIEAPLGRYTFLSKHNLNMKFTYADEKLAEYLGWDTNELVGQSVFEYHHALDNLGLDKSFKSLFSKGQCETAAYRFLGRKGGYAWVVTQATLIHCVKQNKPLSVVCVNYIISGIECENEVYSARQLEARSVDAGASCDKPQASVAQVDIVATVALLNDNKIVEKEEKNIIEEINTVDTKNCKTIVDPIKERSRPLSVTASLFRIQERPQKEVLAAKKAFDPQKNSQQKPVAITDQIFGDLKKENRQPETVRDNFHKRQLPPEQHLFQGKPILKYVAPSQQVQRSSRPQVVTRSLFAPAPQVQEPLRTPPQTATASIFAPRTKEMNKGFLTFSEDQPGLTMLKDEPEDLTHLAPTPGDVCVPLEDTPFLSDMLDDFMLGNDNYCQLLSPGLPNELRASELGETLKDSDLEESLRSGEIGESFADSDPFMYRDSPSSCSGTPNLLSPALSKSPGSIDSLCSPSGSGGGLSEDEMLMLSIGDVLADEELALRAPYIPMSDQDETLQLLISNDMVMWGPSQPPDKKPKWSGNANNESTDVSSSLEQLLRTNTGNVAVRKCTDHGGGLVVNPIDEIGSLYKSNAKEDSGCWLPPGVKSERSNKRVHCCNGSSIEANTNDSKRIKCSSNSSSCSSSGEEELDLNSKGSVSSRSSQLLQQLMSQQSPVKNCGDQTTRGCAGGGADDAGGCPSGSDESNSTNATHPQQQQSNSVLMNLLVSGCDVRAGYICLTKQKPSKSIAAQ